MECELDFRDLGEVMVWFWDSCPPGYFFHFFKVVFSQLMEFFEAGLFVGAPGTAERQTRERIEHGRL